MLPSFLTVTVKVSVSPGEPVLELGEIETLTALTMAAWATQPAESEMLGSAAEVATTVTLSSVQPEALAGTATVSSAEPEAPAASVSAGGETSKLQPASSLAVRSKVSEALPKFATVTA
jgi:hypothetical protein